MSQETQKSGGAPTIALVVFGVAAMLGGANISANPPAFLAFQKDLEAQGIPLDLGKTVAAIGVFLILFPVIKSFFLKPLQEAIDQRTHSTTKSASSRRKKTPATRFRARSRKPKICAPKW
jgi:F-type H+-transporting ATPase subunit b